MQTPSEEDKKIIDMLNTALQKKADNIQYYEQLAQLAKSGVDKAILYKMKANEQKHYKMLADIYTKITGYAPAEKKGKGKIDDPRHLAGAYEKAMLDTIDMTQLYRRLMLSFLNIGTRDMLYEMITDTQNNAVLFSHLYNKVTAD